MLPEFTFGPIDAEEIAAKLCRVLAVKPTRTTAYCLLTKILLANEQLN